MKKIIVLGGGGFIGGHLAKKLKDNGNYVRVCDLKRHEYFEQNDFCNEFILGDLTDPDVVSVIIDETYDEVYQLAADMGGAGYIFTGENDANVMRNSAMINLNVANECVKKNIKKIFYSSSACMYPEHNQLDSKKPNCEESSAYPANPDSEYGWEKLFSERLYLAYSRNYGLNVRIARFHNIFGPYGTWRGGKEKAPAAMCRKACELNDGDELEVWGNGNQTRSFLYIDECIESVLRFMSQENFTGPVNIGSEEMVTINELADFVIKFSKKNIKIKNLCGEDFEKKYGFKCPIGVNGRNSDNRLYEQKMKWVPSQKLEIGLLKTYEWINNEVQKSNFQIANETIS